MNSNSYETFLKDTRTESHKYLIQYLYATQLKEKSPEKSCNIYSQLLDENNFYFKDMAYVRAIETCNHEIKVDRANIFPWLKQSLTSIELEKCRLKSSPECINAFISNSKQNLPYSEKVRLIETALQKAKNIGHKKLIASCQKRLTKIAPRFLKRKKKADYLKVANDYRKNRDFEKAKYFYEKIISGKFSTKIKIRAYRGFSKSYKLQRNYKQYVAELGNLHNYILKTRKRKRRLISYSQLNRSSLEYARATWTYNSRKKAERILANAILLLNKKHSLAEIYWVLGRISEEKMHFKSAIWWFKKASKEKTRNLDLRDKIYWFLAWNEKKLKKYDQAVRSLERLIKLTENQFARAKYQFWVAKIHHDQKRKSKAKKLFQEIIRESPMSFYALLAHKYTGQKISYAKDQQQNFSVDKTLYKTLNLLSVDWLLLFEENDAAKTLLKRNVKKHRSKFNEDDFKTVFHYFAKTELYLEFFYLVSIPTPERQISLLNKNPEFLFPQPYKEIVTRNARELQFDPNVVYSIMRQESAFDPKARSFADAFGLLQLIPKVALQAKSQIEVKYEKVDDLFDPAINIRLGSYYLKRQWDKYDQSFILATASYNATEKAIASWVKTRYKGNILEFIEDIPYEETRNYIKLVMRNYIFYKLINSSGSIPFPDYCLKIGKLNL